MKLGRIAVVGAGPGDPSWLTLRAVELLRVADVVAYDEGISEPILATVPARAELIAVARRDAEASRSLQPELKARALRGQSVVRLEAGDPLGSGLAAEEAEELAEVGIELEIVPGIRAALGDGRSKQLPLAGKTIVVARARPGRSEIGRRLRDLGAIAIELPHVEKGAALPLSSLISDATQKEVALLSSVDAVEAWLDAAPAMPSIALGGEVAALLRAAKRPPLFTLRGACVEALEEAREYLAGHRVIVPIAAGSRTTLDEPLAALGATPVVVAIAAQQRFAPAHWPARIDLVVLPSSLAALALYSGAPPSIAKTRAIAIGPRSAAQAIRCGASQVQTATHDTIDSLLASVLESLTPVSHAVAAHADVEGAS